jgi:GrpB-like predicted nucleotidyltransferase (UPF0157 family)
MIHDGAGDTARSLSSSNLGLAYGRVSLVVDEDGVWPVAFERLAKTIRATLRGDVVCVEHVGSTAVPGLVSKPIIDVAVGLAEGADIS